MADIVDDTAAKPKKKKGKKLLVIGGGVLILAGGGAGAGMYFGGSAVEKAHEDPNRPMLVLRGETHEAAAAGEGGGEDKGPPRRVGTVAAASDTIKPDPKKYEIAYYPLEQSFTANLADGGGFAQIGISLATYFDSRVGDNIERQMVPIRSAVLMVLSDQQAEVLATPAGKQMLQRRLTQAINGVLREKEGFGGIDNVYFNNLVVQ
ncbi:MAG TPA: flagellar basal body-associated FliL family protein [Sphingomonas sp.]|jgi:flagellar FliL protein|nr:flagellar basal body-associated FliL family protein [Sphingomonas sp.]